MDPLLTFTWEPIASPEPTESKFGARWFSSTDQIAPTIKFSNYAAADAWPGTRSIGDFEPSPIETWPVDGAKAVNAAATYSAREGRWISDMELVERRRQSLFNTLLSSTLEKYSDQLRKNFLAYSPAATLLLGSGK